MDKDLLVDALTVFFGGWTDHTEEADFLIRLMQAHCEHRWARWELTPTFQAPKSVCGLCGKEKEVDAMRNPW